MATVFNTIETPNGDAAADAKIEVHLVWDADTSPIARLTGEQKVVSGVYSTRTNASGYWSVDLNPNDDITPTSVYKVVERTGFGEDATTYWILVPDNATPTFWVGDILTTEPSYG